VIFNGRCTKVCIFGVQVEHIELVAAVDAHRHTFLVTGHAARVALNRLAQMKVALLERTGRFP
jgi:hypothetical protein